MQADIGANRDAMSFIEALLIKTTKIGDWRRAFVVANESWKVKL